MIRPRTLIQGMASLLISAFYAESSAPYMVTATANVASGISQADSSAIAKEVRAFRELKYGMIIHYGMSTYDGNVLSDGSTPAQEYNPTDLDVDQWVRVAKEAGMKYIVLVAKHVAGFCIWDSKVQWKGEEFAYDVGASPVKTDVVAAFMEACKKYGIVPGIYYCAMDRRHSFNEISWNPSLPCLSDEYFQLMKDHLAELHTLYPSIAIQWIDIPRHLTMGQRETLYNLVRDLNPDCLMQYNYGKESGGIKGAYTIEVAMKVTWPTDVLNSEVNPVKQPFQVQQEHNGITYELAYEHCISLMSGWFWNGSGPKSLEELTSAWNETRELNGNFLLNVPPDKSGQIPEAYIQRLNEIRTALDLDTATTSIDNNINIPAPDFKVRRIYPEALHSAAMLEYQLNRSSHVSFTIYNLSGKRVETLVNGYQTAGGYEITWQPKGQLRAGTYLFRLQAGDIPAASGRGFSVTEKFTVQK